MGVFVAVEAAGANDGDGAVPQADKRQADAMVSS